MTGCRTEHRVERRPQCATAQQAWRLERVEAEMEPTTGLEPVTC
jgi:hypothetical protein